MGYEGMLRLSWRSWRLGGGSLFIPTASIHFSPRRRAAREVKNWNVLLSDGIIKRMVKGF
jgi:hypothetical protein